MPEIIHEMAEAPAVPLAIFVRGSTPYAGSPWTHLVLQKLSALASIPHDKENNNNVQFEQ